MDAAGGRGLVRLVGNWSEAACGGKFIVQYISDVWAEWMEMCLCGVRVII